MAKSDPTNAELHEVLAQSCWWAKNYSCALDEFHKILQQNPDSPAAHMLSEKHWMVREELRKPSSSSRQRRKLLRRSQM